MTSLKEDVRRSAMLCILTVPATMTSHDLMKFVASFYEVIEHMKIIRDSTPNQYMVLIKFSSQVSAGSPRAAAGTALSHAAAVPGAVWLRQPTVRQNRALPLEKVTCPGAQSFPGAAGWD